MNNKTMKIVCIVMAVIMAVSAAVFFASMGNKGTDAPEIKNPEPVIFSYEQSAYTTSTALSVKGANGEIFMPTDFENIYYTATLNNEISFYDYAGGAMTKSALEVKSVSAKLKASRETIPVTVKYIEKDGRACGYGVFTSDMDSGVDAYSYAFVKLTAKPAGYGGGYLLLADFDKDNFYKVNKLYSEIYNFDLSGGKTSTYVSNHTRMVDINGTFRQDWTILTDDFIRNMGNGKYFLSSRYYNESDKGNRADVMVLSNAYRPKIEVEDILGVWFVIDSNGMHYLKNTDSGFAIISNADGKETVHDNFEGNWKTDYMQCGKYLINRKTLVMTDLLSGMKKTLEGINIENADIFSVNADGTKAVFASYGEINANGTPVQSVTYCTTDNSASPVTYAEPMLFSESGDFIWLDASSVMSVRATTADGKTAGSVVYTF